MKRILVADDQEFMPELVQMKLDPTMEKVEVIPAFTPDEAIEAFRKHLFALVVTDLDFQSDKTGVDVIRTINNEKTFFIINTSNPEFRPGDEDIINAANVKVIDSKPNLGPVIEEIRRKLEQIQ